MKSYCHRGGDEPLTGLTIPEHFLSIARQYPDHEALVVPHQQRRLTYQQLADEVMLIARGLIGLGFEKGDRIGIWSTNNAEWVLLQLATAQLGCVLVNINPAYRPNELAYALKQADLHGLFTIPKFRHSDYVQMLSDTVPELRSLTPTSLSCEQFPSLKRVVVYDPLSPMMTNRTHPGFTVWQELITAASDVGDQTVLDAMALLDCDEPINIQFTSGTTGFPKAVLLTHHNILNNAYFSAKTMRFSSDDRLCVPVPFYHCFGMVLANLLCVSVGACIVVAGEHFDAEDTLTVIDSECCTAVHGVPTMFIAMLEHSRFNQFDLTSLRTGIMAGAPCPVALMTKVIEDMHCEHILIGYGQTEASPLTHLTHVDDSLERRTETVGINLPHQEVKIIDSASGKTVGIGEQGEVCFRGYHIMRAYYNNLEATQEAIDEAGWLHSGDLGVMDDVGYVRITGRLKDMIIRGGENIYPREIEDALFEHSKIAEAAVFGVPDDYYGEKVMAWVQLHEGQAGNLEEMQSYCRERMAHFKVPEFIWFVSEFPMTVTGKLQKYRMREIAIASQQKHGGYWQQD